MQPVIIESERLILRLADPNNDDDCEAIVRFYQSWATDENGRSVLGINDIADVRMKYEVDGPKARLCTRSEPPYGHYFLVFLPGTPTVGSSADKTRPGESAYIGGISMLFRESMPCPDLGWAIFPSYQGKGYATEAAKRALEWWRDDVGVKEVFARINDDNLVSVKCAERVGFVKGGRVEFTWGPNNDQAGVANAYILPGMEWKEFDEQGCRIAT